MQKTILFFLLLLFVAIACQRSENADDLLLDVLKDVSPTGELSYYTFPDSDDYAALPHQDPANPVTREKVKLGQMLFFETGIAQHPMNDNCYETYSCATCHVPSAGFLPGRIQGVADGAIGFGDNGEFRLKLPSYPEEALDAQGTRPLNPLNSGYSTNTLWSGAFGATGVNEGTEAYWSGLTEVNFTGFMGLEAQNIEAFDLHRMAINDHVLDDYGYRALFDDAFPDFPEEERYSETTASFAISAFLRSFLANKAAFQEYLKGDHRALTANQKEGALLFFGKARCFNCHEGPALNAMDFHALGTPDLYQSGGLNTGPDDPRNLGRGMFTGQEEDMYRFKVPQLYNLKDYAMYFHGSSKNSLEEVLEYKMQAQSENPQVANSRLSPYFKPLDLTPKERDQLLDFLENALYDPDMSRYIPDEVLSGNCFPNNDALSKEQMGCE